MRNCASGVLSFGLYKKCLILHQTLLVNNKVYMASAHLHWMVCKVQSEDLALVQVLAQIV